MMPQDLNGGETLPETDHNKNVLVSVRMTRVMAEKLDEVRGDLSRSDFLRRCFADVYRRNR